MGRRIIALLLSLMLLCAVFACAFAEGGPSILGVTQDKEGDKSLLIEIKNELGDASVLSNYSATLGGKPLNLQEVYSKPTDGDNVNETAKAQTTWLFLVDVSTVSSNDGTEPLVDTLTTMVNSIGNEDNAAIVTTASPIPGELISDRNNLVNLIKPTASSNKQAKQLYYAISQAMDYLANANTAKPNRRLVVLSRGDNTDATGITLPELQEKIKGSSVSIYTMAFLDGSKSSEFGSLARASKNGLEINYTTLGTSDKKEIPNAVALALLRQSVMPEGAVSKQVEPIYLLRASQPEKGSGQALELTFTNSSGEQKTTYTISDFDVEYKQEKGFFEKFAEGLKNFEPMYVAMLAGAVVLVALIIVVIILLVGRKRSGTKKHSDDDVPPPVPMEAESIPEDAGRTSPVTNPDRSGAKRLELTLRDNTGKVYHAIVGDDGVTAGRMGDNQIVLKSQDQHISRHHFIVNNVGGELVIENISETNGVYVNEMKISGPVTLRQRDVIRVGSTKLTVTWKFE